MEVDPLQAGFDPVWVEIIAVAIVDAVPFGPPIQNPFSRLQLAAHRSPVIVASRLL